MTTEIPQKSWDTFCRRLKTDYRGAVTVRWTQPGGDARIIAESLPLQTIAFQKRDNECSDALTVEAAEGNARPLQHQIIEPIRLVLRKNGETGRYHELDILAETGKTEITFIPGLDPSLLDKLAA
jgi:hypothetical protein